MMKETKLLIAEIPHPLCYEYAIRLLSRFSIMIGFEERSSSCSVYTVKYGGHIYY